MLIKKLNLIAKNEFCSITAFAEIRFVQSWLTAQNPLHKNIAG